jgi:hypothetical protein
LTLKKIHSWYDNTSIGGGVFVGTTIYTPEATIYRRKIIGLSILSNMAEVAVLGGAGRFSTR